MLSKVSIVRCLSYDKQEVYEAVQKGVSLLGGASVFIRPGEKIVLKVNLLAGDAPEKCVTTHPSVFWATARLFGEAGGNMQFGDSPGFGSLANVARKSGLTPVAEELGIDTANFSEGQEVFFEKGVQNRKFIIAQGVLEADGLISLPKLKTHGLTRYTGCIKNQFGCIVGMNKVEFHMKLPDAHEFSRMLVDVNNFIRPRLYIMDGIMAMEGNGPRGGKPKTMNVLLFSTDPVALDATACRLIDLDPLHVPTIRYGYESGAGTYLAKEIELLGDAPEHFFAPDFKVDRTPVRPYKKGGLAPLLSNSLVAKPVLIPENCTQCGTCIANCPVDSKAVNWKNGDKSQPPVFDYDKCIRCYCCQEICPDQAIILKYPVLRRIMRTFS